MKPMKPLFLTLLASFLALCAAVIPASAQTFNYTGSVQSFTAPATGIYHIVVDGASGGGGNSPGGLGAEISGDFTLVAGESLNIYVGGMGGSGANSGGGGGGSGNPGSGGDGLIVPGTGSGGSGGGNFGGGGGGFNSGGTSGGTCGGAGGSGFPTLTGGSGNCSSGTGGYGGGGGGGVFGGGGGGYSGGSGGHGAGGGGGGSFFSPTGVNETATAGKNSGNGKVVITLILALTDTFQIRYTSNLINGGDSVIDITNTGASATGPVQNNVPNAQTNINGSLCVNIYTFAADEQEVACCSCLVTPNALWSASVKTALLNSTLTPSFPNEVVIKLISTVPNTGAGGVQTCNPATAGTVTPGGGGALTSGLLAWGTSLHGVPTVTGPTFSMAETPFLPATLTAAELQRDVQECQFIQILGSGQFGICKGCSNVGLGAAAQ